MYEIICEYLQMNKKPFVKFDSIVLGNEVEENIQDYIELDEEGYKYFVWGEDRIMILLDFKFPRRIGLVCNVNNIWDCAEEI